MNFLKMKARYTDLFVHEETERFREFSKVEQLSILAR